MKLAVRVQAISKKATLIIAAFVLAVSTLTAAVPFVLSQRVSAVAGTTLNDVADFDVLKDALANPAIGYINLAPNVTINATEELVLSRSDVRINGNDSVLALNTATSSQSGWKGDYVFQVYNATNVEINSLRVLGGDAGFLINGSQVVLKGNTHVDGHEFGGIEVSRGAGAGLNNSQLTLQGALWSQTAPFETQTKPSVWVIDGQGSVNSTSLYQTLTSASYVAPGKTYLYRNASLTDAVATNTTQHIAYNSVQTAIDAAATGNTVRVEKDIALNSMVRVTTPLTLDGNGKTLTAGYSFTVNGVDNAVVTVLADNVTLKNLTTTNTATGQKPHGLVAYEVAGLNLSNVTFKNGRAGAIVNGSTVVADGLHTSGNSWYGVNVDLAGASLTLRGVNTHTEPVAILNDDTAAATVIDQDNAYVKYNLAGAKSYYAPGSLRLLGPADGSSVKGASLTNSWTAAGGAHHYVYESYNDAAGTSLRWRENFTATSKTATNVADATFYWRVTAVDGLGNKSDATPLWKVAVDSTAPAKPTGLVWTTSTGRVLQSGDATNQANGTASWTASSATDFSHYVYRYSNNISGNQYATTPWEVNVNGPAQAGAFNQGEGTHYFSVAAVDKAGNQSPWSDAFAVVFDATRPTVEILAANRANVSGTTDAGATVIVAVNGVDRAPVTADQAGTWSYVFTPALGNGVQTITARATDAAGNETLVAASWPPLAAVVPAPIITPVSNTPEQSSAPADNGVNNGAPVQFPSAVGGVAAILGTEDAAVQSGAANDDSAEVEGANTVRNLAQAVDTDSTDGTVFGLAWYWWLLILAGLATIIWWIIAALRRGREEA